MSDFYLIVLKNKELFNSTVKTVALFNKFESAYEFGKNLEPGVTKLIYSKEDVDKNNVLWDTTKTSLPYLSCKLYTLSNEVVLNIYLSCQVNEKNLMQYLYKHLKVNAII